MIYHDEDKNNSNLYRAMMGHFSRFINDVYVKESPLHGIKFTWHNSRTNISPTLVKLYQVFCTIEWEKGFPNCLLESTASNDSDHWPLVLCLKDIQSGKQ
jgi:hypothetical protein